MSDTTKEFPALGMVDLGALFSADDSARKSTDRAVLAAFDSQSGFVATRFPGADRLQARIERMLTFFDLPEDRRQALATRHYRPQAQHCYRGFFPLPRERGWAHNEIFDYGPATPSRAPLGHPVKPFLEESNQWPDPLPDPGWRDEALSLLTDLRALSVTVMESLVRTLNLDGPAFMAAFADDNSTLRILHYPPAPDDFVATTGQDLPEMVDSRGRRIVTKRHIDACVLSLLWQDQVGGLQYEGRDGVWREVPPKEGCLSIHIGQSLERMTAGRLKGTPHRVIGMGRDRCSMGMFLEPMYSAVIDHDAGGRPVTYADHMKNDFAHLDIYALPMGEAVAA